MPDFASLALTFKDIVPWPWIQIPGLILLIGIIIGWIMYRRRQM
jgi:hypothetical protein